MIDTRKLAAILVADIVGYSRLVGADEDRTLARLRALRGELIDPTIALHRGRVVKHTGDGALVEFRSVVDAVRCAIAIQRGAIERNTGVPYENCIELRIGINLGDVVEEADGDLMGDGVNIAARLEALSEPNGICISEDAHRQVRDKLKVDFTDLGERELKNIARPVRVYAVKFGSDNSGAPEPRASLKKTESSPHLSIVVLPFANISGDPDQDYFVDGVTESLTTDLSRIAGSFVIARNTAFTYKGKHADLKQIGRELNVRYALEGSVQRGGNRLRVSVRLVDAGNGNHLWAERFDKPLADLLDMQDEIVSRLANALSAQLVAVEARRAERQMNPDATDLFFQGWAWWNKGMTPDTLAEARRYYERALALDPANVPALVDMANADLSIAIAFAPDDRVERLNAAQTALTEALSLAPDNAVAHMCQGILHIHTNRVPQGIRECERALELDRNLVHAHAQIGAAKILLGKAEESEGHVREALRLSPRDPLAYLWCMYAGWGSLCLGKDEEAVAWLRRSIEVNRNFSLSHFFLAAGLARLGRFSEAQSETHAGLAIDPTFTTSRARASMLSDNSAVLAGWECVSDGLRKAGVPER